MRLPDEKRALLLDLVRLRGWGLLSRALKMPRDAIHEAVSGKEMSWDDVRTIDTFLRERVS